MGGESLPYAPVARVRNFNLRPIVLAFSAMTGIWTLIWSIGFFKEIPVDKKDGFTKLADSAYLLEIIYIVVAAINFFGVVAALLQHPTFVHIYSYSSVLSSTLVVGASFIRVLVRTVLKDDMVQQCVKAVTDQRVDFRWGTRITGTLTEGQATGWCEEAFSHDYQWEIVLFVASFSFMGLMSFIVWAYAHAMSPSNHSYYIPLHTSEDTGHENNGLEETPKLK